MRALFVALALVVLARAADGAIRITSAVPEDDAIADGQTTDVVIQGEVDCSSILARQTDVSLGLQMRVHWSGAGLLITGPGQEVLDATRCAQEGPALPVEARLQVAVLRSARAMVPQQGLVTWDFAPSSVDDADPANATASFAIAALPLVGGHAEFPVRQAIVADMPVTFTGNVMNLGNGPLAVVGEARFVEDAVDSHLDATAEVMVGELQLEAGVNGTIEIKVTVPEGRWVSGRVVGNLTFTSLTAPVPPPTTFAFQMQLLDDNELDHSRASMPVWPALIGLAMVAGLRRRKS